MTYWKCFKHFNNPGILLSLALLFACNSSTGPGNGAAAVPGAPITVTGVPGNAQAIVYWAPASSTDSSIISYTATAVEDTSKRCTAVSVTYCVVKGLINGLAHTFTVTATNAAGTSAPSTPSAPVTPLLSIPEIFLQTPGSMTVLSGGVATLAVQATGHDSSSPFQYKWVKNNTDTLPDFDTVVIFNGADSPLVIVPSTISGNFVQGFGYTTNNLVIYSASAANAGSWKCIVRNSHGIAVSEPVALNVVNVIDWPPATRVLYERGAVRFRRCVICHPIDSRGIGEATPSFHRPYFEPTGFMRCIRLQLLGLPNFIDTATTIAIGGGRTKNIHMETTDGNDSDIAGVLTYIRDRFYGATDSVAPQMVGIARDSLVDLCAQHMSENPDHLPCIVDPTH